MPVLARTASTNCHRAGVDTARFTNSRPDPTNRRRSLTHCRARPSLVVLRLNGLLAQPAILRSLPATSLRTSVRRGNSRDSPYCGQVAKRRAEKWGCTAFPDGHNWRRDSVESALAGEAPRHYLAFPGVRGNMAYMGVGLRNWAGNVEYAASALHEPLGVDHLQELVAGSSRVRAVGSGHSFNRIADTTGELVSVRRLELPIELDPDARTATVPGGARYAEVTAALDAQGWALHNLGSLPHISVAGACATGTHGSGNTNQNLAAAVEAVEFVRADGELVHLSQGDGVFAGAVLALGALGVVTRLTLRIEPAYPMRQDVYLDMPLAAAAEHVLEILAAAYSVSVFSDWHRPDVLDTIWLKRRAGPSVAAPQREWLGARLATTPQHPIPGLDASTTSPQLGQVGPWHERLPHFHRDFTPSSGAELQSEYFLPRAVAPQVLHALRAIADRLDGALLVFELRTVAADDLWLSPCYGRDTVAAHFTWVDDVRATRPALAAVEAALDPLDARPHWAKVFLGADAPRFAAMYPRLAQFRALAAEYDPNRCFGNEFLERYVY